MSAQSKGTASSSSSPSEGPPAASKAKVKEQIKIIVEDLELVLGDLKDVAKELKEVRSAGSGEHSGRTDGLPRPPGAPPPLPLAPFTTSSRRSQQLVAGPGRAGVAPGRALRGVCAWVGGGAPGGVCSPACPCPGGARTPLRRPALGRGGRG